MLLRTWYITRICHCSEQIPLAWHLFCKNWNTIFTTSK